MAKKKVNIEVANGKVETTQPTTLDQILGIHETSLYKTDNEDEYTQSLKEMNLADLQIFASRLGLLPGNRRDALEKKLIAEFKKTRAMRVPSNKSQIITPNISKEAMAILKQGA